MSDDFFTKLGRLSKPSGSKDSAAGSAAGLVAEEETRPAPASLLAPKDAHESAMWKLFLQFKSVLPYVSKLLPLLDIGLMQQQNSGLSQELRQNITSLQVAQRETQDAARLALQDQAVQIKRVEDQLTLLREVSEKHAVEHAELVKNVKSLHGLVRNAGVGLVILLLVLIVMVGVLLAHISY